MQDQKGRTGTRSEPWDASDVAGARAAGSDSARSTGQGLEVSSWDLLHLRERGTHVGERGRVLEGVQLVLVRRWEFAVLKECERVERVRADVARDKEGCLGAAGFCVHLVDQVGSSFGAERVSLPSEPDPPPDHTLKFLRFPPRSRTTGRLAMYDPLAPSSASSSSTPAWPSSPHDPSDLPPHLSPSTPSSSVFRQQQQRTPLIKPEEVSRPVRLASLSHVVMV